MSIPEARLVLIGQGEDEAMLKEKTKELGLQNKIYFAGVQYDIGGWLSAFDLFVFPSVFEGLPLVALEAQANGIVILSSEEAVPKEGRINTNFTSFRLSEGTNAWAQKIIELKEQKQRINSEVIKERFSSVGYDIETEVKRLEELFLR